MPELPEVQTVVSTLTPLIQGATIAKVLHLRPDMLTPSGIDLPSLLENQSISSLHRRGKKILLRLSSNCTLCIHLGMTGRLTIESPDSPLQPHTHLILSLSTANCQPPTPQLRFRDPRRFGRISFFCPHEPPDHGLGPEPLTLRPSQLAKLLSTTRRPIKSALLDQRLIAGLGNIYVDESLFLAHIHPTTLAKKLTSAQISKLNRAIKSTLRRAIHHRGSTLRDYVDATGVPGRAQLLHRVYDRKGLPCPTCKTAISRITLSGRSTHFCHKCQRVQRRS